MILLAIVILPLLGGIAAWAAEPAGPVWPRRVALAVLAVDAALGLWLWTWPAPPGTSWVSQLYREWIPRFGISLHLAADGLSVLLINLTTLLGLVSVAASWREIRQRPGFFHFCLLWSLAGALGVFVAVDLFLFFFLWEVMLVPMYFLIALWGHENRLYAAFKFFLFTQGGGLLMLVSILALVFLHAGAGGQLSFDYFDLLGTRLPANLAAWLLLGFFIAFAVKLPAVPLHPWLVDAHTEAPTAGSVILAGILLKTGAYGLLRFALPLFPDAARNFAPVAMGLGVAGILYGAVLAYGQDDLKRLVAYTSVSHMGFVLLGIFAGNPLATSGAVATMLAHGLSTGGLFVLVGALQERMGTRDLRRMGGLWSTVPRLAAWSLFLAAAALGLPGLGNFVGEFLVLFGTFHRHAYLAAAAALGLVAAAAYALILVQRAFHGENLFRWQLQDCDSRENAIMVALAAGIVGIGLFPMPLLGTALSGAAPW